MPPPVEFAGTGNFVDGTAEAVNGGGGLQPGPGKQSQDDGSEYDLETTV